MTRPSVSFEFFPPKSIDASFRFWNTVQALTPLEPQFVSVTYGAGGTTRRLTHDTVRTLHSATGLNVAAHLTCVDATQAQTLQIARDFANAGVTDIVALRGDPPKGRSAFVPHPDGFANSCELISALADTGDFTIRVGAYPETHPEAISAKADIDWLKRKIDSGASGAITQFFFEADTFFRFRDACMKAGIHAPIIPGILPIENWDSARKFARTCKAGIPDLLENAFARATREDERDLLAIAIATELCGELLDGGTDHLHFYTQNKPDLTREICHAIGVTPRVHLQHVA